MRQGCGSGSDVDLDQQDGVYKREWVLYTTLSVRKTIVVIIFEFT
jgi:hypothetical protein